MYIVELKYAKVNFTDNELQKLKKQTFRQLEQYTSSRDFQAMVKHRGWYYHKIIIIMRGREMVFCEQD